MSDEMYFMPIIAKALQQDAPTAAMRKAFERIESMSQEPRYRSGYQQFMRFMAVAGEKNWPEKMQQLWTELCKTFDRPSSVQVLIAQDGNCVAVCSLEASSGIESVGGITPGAYRLSFDTGRVLWQGNLTAQELLWDKAFPGQPLRMAADSDHARRCPSREIPLLGGVIVRVYPGMEAGVLEIEFNAQKGSG